MTIARTPHPVFVAVWAVLVLAMLVATVVGGIFATYVLAGIAIAEGVAVPWRTKFRTTLSELTTWYNRKLSKHTRPFIGWNTLVAMQALALGRLVYIVGVYWGGPSDYMLVFAALFGWGQHAHWLNPGVNG